MYVEFREASSPGAGFSEVADLFGSWSWGLCRGFEGVVPGGWMRADVGGVG